MNHKSYYSSEHHQPTIETPRCVIIIKFSLPWYFCHFQSYNTITLYVYFNLHYEGIFAKV